MLGKILLVCAVCLITGSYQEITYSNVFQMSERISSDGFPSETHTVTTSDGYILAIHRIPHGRNPANTGDKPVVFLMHGLMGASNNYVTLGPDHGVAYNLADAGYDVWMGNARGNVYSRAHIRLNPDGALQKRNFWDFTWDEIGAIDVPTMIDYVLKYTNKAKLHYIGHSQGGTSFLVMTSLKPEYNDKIASAHLLAGVGNMKYFPHEGLSGSAANVDTIYNLANIMGIVELYPELLSSLSPSSFSASVSTADNCTGNPEDSHMCELFGVRHLLHDDSDSVELVPSGASLKQAAHYGQNIRDKLFRRYDHGSRNNRAAYGTSTPPLYNLSLITANVTMHYSLSDILLDERDVLAMAAAMPNTVVRQVARDSFLHEDYVAAFDAKELVTDYIVRSLKYTDSRR